MYLHFIIFFHIHKKNNCHKYITVAEIKFFKKKKIFFINIIYISYIFNFFELNNLIYVI